MEPALLAVAGWLEVAGLGPWARGNAAAYPIANVLHLLGLVLLVGGIGIVDLRILGCWRGLPLAPLSRALTPVALAGLALQVPTGLVLFAADSRALAGSTVFHAKLLLMTLALANAVLFRLACWRPAGREVALSGMARTLAGLSLLLWLGVATLGRLIAYY